MTKQEIEDKAGGLPAFIRRKREEMGLSLRELAEKLPITASTVGMLEQGEHVPAMPVLKAFARVFNTPLSEIEGMLPAGATPREKIPGKGKGHMPRHRPSDRDDEHDKRGDEDIEFTFPGATSFAELREGERAQRAAREVRKLANQIPELVEGIFQDPNIEDKEAAIADLGPEFSVFASEEMSRTKERWQPLTDAVANAITPLIDKQAMKTEGGIKFPREDFAFTPSDNVSSWKLRLAEDRPGNITRSQLGAAAAAFSPGGFRGQKVQIPSGDVAAVKAKIRAAYKKIGVEDDDIPASVRKELETKNSFMVYKESDGGYRWMAIYSNKFRDRDNPPEIISEASHIGFAKSVNSGELPFPELWLWHVDGSRWGEADFVGYDDNGFAVATGTIDKGKEWVADVLMGFEGELLTSHGMPKESIERNDLNDPTVITGHITKEISPLPANAAANKHTGFSILGEVTKMAFTDEERARLLALKVDPDQLESQASDKAKETEGLEYKKGGKDDFVSRDEVSELVKSVASSTNQLVTVVGDLAKRLETLEANKLTIDKETLEATPAASLAGLYESVIGAPETKVDGRSALAKSGPKEAPVQQSDDGSQGSRFGGGMAKVIATRNQEIERGGVQ